MARRSFVRQLMGLPVSIHVRGQGVHARAVEAAVEQVFEGIEHYERVFSLWRADSQLSRLRDGVVHLDQCDPLVAQSMRIAFEASERTRGAFTTDLVGPDGRRGFDPTGLVKGWSVKESVAPLRSLAGISWCVNAGGDVIVGRHAHVPPLGDDAAAWRIGIEDPRDRSAIARVVALSTGAVATSGTAARGAHLHDPVSGEAVTRDGSTTVIGPDLLWCDIWASALFVGGEPTWTAFEAERDYQVISL